MNHTQDLGTEGVDAPITVDDVASARRTIALHRLVFVVCGAVLCIGSAALAVDNMNARSASGACVDDAAKDFADVTRGFADGVYSSALRVTHTPQGTLIEGRRDVFLVVEGHIVGTSSRCLGE